MHIAARVVRGPGQSIALSGFFGLGDYTPLSPTVKTLTQLAATAAGNGDLLTFDQWNYYAQQPPPGGAGASGLPGIEATPLGTDHTALFTIDQWWTGLTAVTGVQGAAPASTTPGTTTTPGTSTNTSQPPATTPPAPVVTVPTCSFYQSYDATSNTCGLNYYLVGGVLGVGFLLLMMGKKKRG